MESSTSAFTQNGITKEFIAQVNELVDKRRMSQKDIITKLNWNKSSMSSVMNGNRDVPVAKWELFKSVYKDANLETEMKTGVHPHTQEVIDLLKEEIKRLKEEDARLKEREAHLKALNTELSEKIKKDLENISLDHIEVKASLKTSIGNQLMLTAMLESTIENLAEVLIEEPRKQLEFCGKIHRKASALQLALNESGSHLEIRNNDIVSR